MANWIPPGGFAGFAQSTPAMIQNTRSAGRATMGTGTKRRRSRKKKAAGVKRRAKRASSRKSSKKARLVKGSAAAKRYMAKIRKLRK